MPKIKLETIGKILTAGFGDRVLIGIFMGFLDGVTPARAYEYIKDNIQLGHWVTDSDWNKYNKLVKQANISDITSDDLIKGMRKFHPDILGVIINTPGGNEWLDRQVVEIKKRLGLT